MINSCLCLRPQLGSVCLSLSEGISTEIKKKMQQNVVHGICGRQISSLDQSNPDNNLILNTAVWELGTRNMTPSFQ